MQNKQRISANYYKFQDKLIVVMIIDEMLGYISVNEKSKKTEQIRISEDIFKMISLSASPCTQEEFQKTISSVIPTDAFAKSALVSYELFAIAEKLFNSMNREENGEEMLRTVFSSSKD